MTEQEQLQDQIKHIDQRLAVIEATVARLPPNDYQRSELMDEAASLSGMRNACHHKLHALLGTDDADERARRELNRKRVEQLREARIKSYRRQCEETALECERIGDHRSARLHRLEGTNNARKVSEWEIHE